MSDFEFTVIIPTYNSELGIEDSLNSIINQTLNFNENIEIIIADNNSDDNTEKICKEYIRKYPNNIHFLKQEKLNYHQSKNNALKESKGKFITFLENHDYYSKDSFEKILRFIKKNQNIDLISTPIYYFKNGRKEHYLNCKIKKTEKIDLLKKPEYAQLIEFSTFFKKSSAENLKFNNADNENITFFSEILLKNPILGICSEAVYYSNNIDEKIYQQEDHSFSVESYDNFIKFNFNNLIEKSLKEFSEIPVFIQYMLMNHARWLSVIEKCDEKISLNDLSKNIQYLNDETILNNRLIDNDIKISVFLLKYHGNIDKNIQDKLGLFTVFIDTFDIVNDELHVLASISNIYPRDVDVFVNGEKISKNELRFPQKDKYSLNTRYCEDYSFEFNIPLNVKNEYNIKFMSNNEMLKIDFSRPCNFSKIVGYAKTRHYLSILKNDTIHIEKKTTLKWIKEESKALVKMVKNHESGFLKAIPFRIAYMIGYPFLKNKHIWFYMDRPYESDDNGLHLFKYAVEKDPEIDKYFILSSKNKEFNNIKKIGNVLSYKSLKHRYLGMFVENIVTSHPDNEVIYPFWGGYPFFAGLLKSNNIFLQHGVLKDDISSWLNKSNMNLSFFLVSSPAEYESIFKFPYNYDKNIVQLLGLPRYDTLENQKDKHEIIIMPSWRRNLDHKSKEHFKESEFFKRFNSLINNEKLIKIAKEHDYKIIFRPHPKVYDFIELYESNDYVTIDYEKVNYQTLFNNGSLLITDYSSVAFDFAYLHKPTLYYQYGEDYHFDLDDSYYDYETMGFGEVIKTEDQLVNEIIEYIENDCKIKEKYSQRINDFFLYTDKNNCKRVYDKIKEIPLKD